MSKYYWFLNIIFFPLLFILYHIIHLINFRYIQCIIGLSLLSLSIQAKPLTHKIQKEIQGKIFLLRKQLESPNSFTFTFDLHFRKFLYSLSKEEFQYFTEESIYNQKKWYENWSFVIPIEQQAYLHYQEARSLWKSRLKKEAIFLWKSLTKARKHKKIAIASQQLLQKKIHSQTFRNLYQKIDPYFLYDLENNILNMFSDEFGFTIRLPDYWNLPWNDKNNWFYFIQNLPSKRILYLYNQKFILYIYIKKFNHLHNQNNKINEKNIISWIDNQFHWNQTTKQQYQFKRIHIQNKIYFVKYIKENYFTSYYEKYFLFSNIICYMRIYNLKNSSQKEQLNLLYSIQ